MGACPGQWRLLPHPRAKVLLVPLLFLMEFEESIIVHLQLLNTDNTPAANCINKQCSMVSKVIWETAVEVPSF